MKATTYEANIRPLDGRRSLAADPVKPRAAGDRQRVERGCLPRTVLADEDVTSASNTNVWFSKQRKLWHEGDQSSWLTSRLDTSQLTARMSRPPRPATTVR